MVVVAMIVCAMMMALIMMAMMAPVPIVAMAATFIMGLLDQPMIADHRPRDGCLHGCGLRGGRSRIYGDEQSGGGDRCNHKALHVVLLLSANFLGRLAGASRRGLRRRLGGGGDVKTPRQANNRRLDLNAA